MCLGSASSYPFSSAKRPAANVLFSLSPCLFFKGCGIDVTLNATIIFFITSKEKSEAPVGTLGGITSFEERRSDLRPSPFPLAARSGTNPGPFALAVPRIQRSPDGQTLASGNALFPNSLAVPTFSHGRGSPGDGEGRRGVGDGAGVKQAMEVDEDRAEEDERFWGGTAYSLAEEGLGTPEDEEFEEKNEGGSHEFCAV